MTEKKTRQGLIDFCIGKKGTPYVFGAKGEKMSQELINRLASENPKIFTSVYRERAKTFIGSECTDCSGLISWYTGKVRGSSNFCDTATERHPVVELNESMRGWALWKPGHIGVYIGDGFCMEAKGIGYGTVKSRVSATPWVKVVKLCDIDYSEEVRPVLRQTGWRVEGGSKKFYLTPELCVRSDWYKFEEQWFWFEGNGSAVCKDWIHYKDRWYYLGDDCAMVTGLWQIGDKFYYFDEEGAMADEGNCLVFRPNKNGELMLDKRGALPA